MRWRDNTPPCEQCKKLYAKRKKEPPCDTCRTDLHPNNEDAIQVYYVVRDQHIVTSGKVVGLNLVAVKAVMDIYNVIDQRRCLEKVLMLYRHFLEKEHD